MRWIPRVVTFTAALVFGAFITSFFVTSERIEVERAEILFEHHFDRSLAGLTASDLLGSWQGNWGYNTGDCSIQITRVEGDSFYGTLRKEGAEILFEGTFDPATRVVYFEETEIVTLGSEIAEWSLGTNQGRMTQDGAVIFGTGTDKFGEYAWALTNR